MSVGVPTRSGLAGEMGPSPLLPYPPPWPQQHTPPTSNQQKIHRFISERTEGFDVHCHTSTLERSSRTVSPFLEMHEAQVADPVCWSALNNLDTGICHGMTVDQVGGGWGVG